MHQHYMGLKWLLVDARPTLEAHVMLLRAGAQCREQVLESDVGGWALLPQRAGPYGPYARTRRPPILGTEDERMAARKGSAGALPKFLAFGLRCSWTAKSRNGDYTRSAPGLDQHGRLGERQGSQQSSDPRLWGQPPGPPQSLVEGGVKGATRPLPRGLRGHLGQESGVRVRPCLAGPQHRHSISFIVGERTSAPHTELELWRSTAIADMAWHATSQHQRHLGERVPSQRHTVAGRGSTFA